MRASYKYHTNFRLKCTRRFSINSMAFVLGDENQTETRLISYNVFKGCVVIAISDYVVKRPQKVALKSLKINFLILLCELQQRSYSLTARIWYFYRLNQVCDSKLSVR